MKRFITLLLSLCFGAAAVTATAQKIQDAGTCPAQRYRLWRPFLPSHLINISGRSVWIIETPASRYC